MHDGESERAKAMAGLCSLLVEYTVLSLSCVCQSFELELDGLLHVDETTF